MIVYFISGLGIDERAFKRIKLANSIEVIHIQWPVHDDNESLHSYCLKIARLIDTSKDFSLVGFSFGGIIVTELSKILSPKKLIIISSISTRSELPDYYKFIGRMKFYKIVPAVLMNKVSGVSNLFNNLHDKADRELVNTIISDTNPYFIKWAIDKILNWSNETRLKDLYHIHGANDRVFFFSKVNADKVIEGGGHFMVLTHAQEISDELNRRLV